MSPNSKIHYAGLLFISLWGIGCAASVSSELDNDNWRMLGEVSCPEPLDSSDQQLGRLLGARVQPKGTCLHETHPRLGERFRLEFRNAALLQPVGHDCFVVDAEPTISERRTDLEGEVFEEMRNTLRDHYDDVLEPLMNKASLCAQPLFRRDRIAYAPRPGGASFMLVWYFEGLKFVSRSECGNYLPADATGCHENDRLPIAVVPLSQLRASEPKPTYIEPAWPPVGDNISEADIVAANEFNLWNDAVVDEAVRAIWANDIVETNSLGAYVERLTFTRSDGSTVTVISKTRHNRTETADALYYQFDRLLDFGVVPATRHMVDNNGKGRAIMVDVPGTSIRLRDGGTLRAYNRFLAAAHTISGWKAAIFHYLVDSNDGHEENAIILDDGRVAVFDLFLQHPPIPAQQGGTPESFFYRHLLEHSHWPVGVSFVLASALRRATMYKERFNEIYTSLYPDQGLDHLRYSYVLLLEKLRLLLQLQRLPTQQEAHNLQSRIYRQRLIQNE